MSGTTGGLSRENLPLSDEKTIQELGLSKSSDSFTKEQSLKLSVDASPLLVRVNLGHSLPRSRSVQVESSFCSSSGGFNGPQEELIDIQTSYNCSVYCLKHLIWKQMPSFPISD